MSLSNCKLLQCNVIGQVITFSLNFLTAEKRANLDFSSSSSESSIWCKGMITCQSVYFNAYGTMNCCMYCCVDLHSYQSYNNFHYIKWNWNLNSPYSLCKNSIINYIIIVSILDIFENTMTNALVFEWVFHGIHKWTNVILYGLPTLIDLKVFF